MEIVERVSLEDVRESGAQKIYYAARTCWWTHDPSHLSQMPAPTEAEIHNLAETMRANSGRTDAPLDEFLLRARASSRHRLPCDPRGSVLFETDNVQGFLDAAERNPEYYGRHELRAFMAAHHSNCQRALDDPRPWSAESWDEYNDALDRLDARRRS